MALIMSGSFETVEDELNFIMGGDDMSTIDEIFDVDNDLHDVSHQPAPPPLKGQGDGEPHAAGAYGGGSAATAAVDDIFGESYARGDWQGGISRLCSLSPRPFYDGEAADPVTPNDGDAINDEEVDKLIGDAFGITPADPTLAADSDNSNGSRCDDEELDDFDVMNFNFDLADELMGNKNEGRKIIQPALIQLLLRQQHQSNRSRASSNPDYNGKSEEKIEVGEPKKKKKTITDVFDVTRLPDVKVLAPIVHSGYIRKLPLGRPAFAEVKAVAREGKDFDKKTLDDIQEDERVHRFRVDECDEKTIFVVERQAEDSRKSDDAPMAYESMIPESAARARLARSKRRSLRAKYQVINMVGDGEVAEVKRLAVRSLDLSRLRPTPTKSRARALKKGKKGKKSRTLKDSFDVAKVERDLLADFTAQFNPEKFVERTFQHACQNMVAATKRAEELAALGASASNTDYTARLLLGAAGAGEACGPKGAKGTARTVSPAPKMAQEQAGRKATQTEGTTEKKGDAGDKEEESETKSSKEVLKTLPSGKDPESRRLRRLMRNRLSAQASRDRRKAALEEQRRIKKEKGKEIERLRGEVAKEAQRMILLENAVAYARTYLGPEHYARIASKAGARGPGDWSQPSNATKADAMISRNMI